MDDDQKSLHVRTQTEDDIIAVVVVPYTKKDADGSGFSPERYVEYKTEEATGLAHAIHLHVAQTFPVKITQIRPSTYLGKGQLETIGEDITEIAPDVVIIDHNLSPGQQRNLEKAWDTKVIDRTGLILEIFGARAQTKEGKIQVELAALEYQKSRLVRSWTHLERQKGGAGFMGGPGERQIEIDRRLITDRIARLKKELDTVRRTRELQQESRKKVPLPVVSLVGYTNAGKSTLFNALTESDVFAKDLLFATLDPTMRKLETDNGLDVILSDTVGFISDLPTHLIAAFRATLEHVEHADIILHVRDMSNPNNEEQRNDVIDIMRDLGIDYDEDERIIEVLNKIDLLDDEAQADLEQTLRFPKNKIDMIPVSAIKKTGFEALRHCISEKLMRDHQTVRFDIPFENGKAIAWLHQYADIIDTKNGTHAIEMHARLSKADIGRFVDKFNIAPYQEEGKSVSDNGF